MKKISLKLIVALSIMVISNIGFSQSTKELLNTIEKDTVGIHWVTLQQVDSLSKIKAKPIFIDMYTDWCGWCKHMDATTFQEKEVIKYANQNFYAVKFDAEGTSKVPFNGKTYESKQKMHDFAIYLFVEGGATQAGYPTIAYLNKDLSYGSLSPGFKKTNGFIKELKNVLEYNNANK